MTNEEIIFQERMILFRTGKIGATGRTAIVIVNDEEREVQEPEEIHTYQAWKSRGFKVRRGEKAVAQFPIWKPATRKYETEDGEEESRGYMFLKKSAFFSQSQVEKIVEE